MTMIRRTMRGGSMRIGVGASAWVVLLLTSGACTPRVEVAESEKPITINLNVKIDHEIRLKVDKELDDVLSNDGGSSAFAPSLDEEKVKGLVGEKRNGYLGAVNTAHADAQVLIEDVNRTRRQAYEDIAKRNGTSVQTVETIAGEKAVQNTKPGNFVEGPGGWVKK